MDSREALLAGGKRGPAMVPGHPEASILWRAVRHRDPALKMPPEKPLSDAEAADLARWIREGAAWPQTGPARAGANHWAFRPIRHPVPPAVKTRGWVRNPIDAFVLARLEARGLRPSAEASRETLLRRVTFDLTGLPPTPDDVRAFLADPRPDAYDRVVDRLLSSPRYGEKWGRHWLDWVRYADSNGLDENYHFANAWRYRDYVIDAFNRDEPLDQFIREQLAGDLLPPAANPQENYRRLVATGFFLLGPKLLANPDKAQVQADIIDEQIDVTSRALLGVTLSCARCHDHKFDPFSQRDYYALAGILSSTRSMISLKDRTWSERPLASPQQVMQFDTWRKELDAAEKALADARKANRPLPGLEARVRTLGAAAPPPVPYAMAVSDGTAADAPLLHRGDPGSPRERVPRGFPAVLTPPRPAFDPTHSGRLELAEWVIARENPLTARVMANRLWQGHFGQGLVRTPDNLGKLGEMPSHPELLDWLAEELRAPQAGEPWSLKRLHRLMVLSAAYRQGSAATPGTPGLSKDPDNRLLWRMNRRRLGAEEQRDAILSAGGRLDLAMGGSLLSQVGNMVRVTTDMSSDLAANSYTGNRRTVYLPVIRNSLFEMLELFDFTDPSTVTARRPETLGSPQALFLLNHPLMREWSASFAGRVTGAGDERRALTEAYLAAFGRGPTAAEADTAAAFLSRHADKREGWLNLCQVLLCANPFLYVD